MASHISGVTSPLGESLGVPSTSFSYAHTDLIVSSPYTPSTGPGQKPRSVRRCWTCATSSPATPWVNVRSSWVLTTGVDVATVAIARDRLRGAVTLQPRILRRRRRCRIVTATECHARHDHGGQQPRGGNGRQPLRGLIRMPIRVSAGRVHGPGQVRSMTGSMPSRSARRLHISRTMVAMTPGELSVDTPRVRGK